MKIGFFITARLKSSRLKNKILLDLKGKSVIDRVIERAKKVKGVDGVVLCTSTNQQDSILYKHALSNKIEFFAGHPDDVLKRLLDAAVFYQYDAFLSITADNPLFSIYTSEILADQYRNVKYDFINITGLPIGCATYLVDVKALQVANYIKQHSDTEIWGPYINNPDIFNIAELFVLSKTNNSKIRLTLDYWQDYVLLSKIYDQVNNKKIPALIDILDIIENDKDLLKINSKLTQRSLEPHLLEEISKNIKEKRSEAIQFARSLNKPLTPKYTKIEVPFD